MLPACDIRQVEPDAHRMDEIEKGLGVSSFDRSFYYRPTIFLIPFNISSYVSFVFPRPSLSVNWYSSRFSPALVRLSLRRLLSSMNFQATNYRRRVLHAKAASRRTSNEDLRWVIGRRSRGPMLASVSHERFLKQRLPVRCSRCLPQRNLSDKVSF